MQKTEIYIVNIIYLYYIQILDICQCAFNAWLSDILKLLSREIFATIIVNKIYLLEIS